MVDQIANIALVVLFAVLGGTFVPWKRWVGAIRGRVVDSNADGFSVTEPPSDETLAYIHAVLTAIGDADDKLILECLDAGDTVYESMRCHRDALAKKGNQ